MVTVFFFVKPYEKLKSHMAQVKKWADVSKIISDENNVFKHPYGPCGVYYALRLRYMHGFLRICHEGLAELLQC